MQTHQDLGPTGVRCPKCGRMTRFGIGGNYSTGYLREGERIRSRCCKVDITDLLFPKTKQV